MARGRMISRTLGSSRRFASIADHAGRLTDFAQALYPLLVSHADDFGRLEGDAFTVKHRVFPVSVRRVADFQQALVVLHEVGLIARYTVDDNEYLEICQFSPHQEGLHKRTRSRFPEPPRDSGNRKASSGKFRESPVDSGDSRKFREIPSQEKGTEENRTEENRSQIRTGGVISRTEDGATTEHPPALWRRLWEHRWPDGIYRTSARDLAELERLVAQFGAVDVTARIGRYLARPDAELVRRMHPLGIFLQQVNEYREQTDPLTAATQAFVEGT